MEMLTASNLSSTLTEFDWSYDGIDQDEWFAEAISKVAETIKSGDSLKQLRVLKFMDALDDREVRNRLRKEFKETDVKVFLSSR